MAQGSEIPKTKQLAQQWGTREKAPADAPAAPRASVGSMDTSKLIRVIRPDSPESQAINESIVPTAPVASATDITKPYNAPRKMTPDAKKAIDQKLNAEVAPANPSVKASISTATPAEKPAPVSEGKWNQTFYQGDKLTAKESMINVAAKNTPYSGMAKTPDGREVPITTVALAQPTQKLMVKVDKQGNIVAYGDAHDTGSALKSNKSGIARSKQRGGVAFPTIDIFQAGRTGLPEDEKSLASANSEESATWRTATPEEIKIAKQTLRI